MFQGVLVPRVCINRHRVMHICKYMYMHTYMSARTYDPTEINSIEAQLGRLPPQLVRIYCMLKSIPNNLYAPLLSHPIHCLHWDILVQLNVALENKTVWDLTVMNKKILDLTVGVRARTVHCECIAISVERSSSGHDWTYGGGHAEPQTI